MLEAILIGLAVNLADRLLKAVGLKVRKRFRGDDRQRALEVALTESLQVAFSNLPLSNDLSEHYESLFSTFLSRESVVEELSCLIDPHQQSEIDLARLHAEFETAGFDSDLMPHFDFDLFIRRMVAGFYTAAAKNKELQQEIQIKELRAIAEGMNALNALGERTADATERTAAATERTAERQDRVVELLERVVTEGGADRRMTRPPHRDTHHPPNEAELAELQADYRTHIVREFDHLTFHWLIRSARTISLPLENLYVELRAVAEVPEEADVFSAEERRLLLEMREEEPESKRELMRELEVLRRERWNEAIHERQPISQALHAANERAFVILGDPGSGKTTLLKLLGLIYAIGPERVRKTFGVDEAEADRLPIFLPLAAFEELRNEEPKLKLFDALWLYYERRHGLSDTKALFENALKSSRVIILLDGLDEVHELNTRDYIARQIQALIDEWTPRGVRFVITSRIVGYRETRVRIDATHLTLLDFREEQIETFVHRWTQAFELSAPKGRGPRVSQRAAAKAEANLLADVRDNPSVRRLAANPLMLTILALLRRQFGRLPKRRIQLYKRYVETLLDAWIQARTSGEDAESPSPLNPHEVEDVLIPVALWLLKKGRGSTAQRAELKRVLIEVYLRRAGYSLEDAPPNWIDRAQEQAERFLQDIREVAGILVERGRDVYGFLHLTLLEYFAGRALALMDEDELWQTIRPTLHDAHWLEPIKLCAGWLGIEKKREKQATNLVVRILHNPDETESDLQRGFLLAMEIAADDVGIDPLLFQDLLERALACLKKGIPELSRAVIRNLARFVVNECVDAAMCFDPIFASDDAALRALAATELGDFAMVPEIRERLITSLEDPDYSVPLEAIKSLGTICPLDPEVRQLLIEQTRVKNRHRVQGAIQALTPAVAMDDEVRSALIDRLGDDRMLVHEYAAAALCEVAAKEPAILQRLLKAHGTLGRGRVMAAIARRVPMSEEVRAALLVELQDFATIESDEFREALVLAVARDGQFYQEMLSRVHQRNALAEASATGDFDAKSQLIIQRRSFSIAIRSLAGVIVSKEEAAGAVLRVLVTFPDVDERKAAILTLAPLAAWNETVRDSIMCGISDDDPEIRQASLKAIGGLIETDATARVKIEPILSDVDWLSRAAAARAMGEAHATPRILKRMHEVAEDLRAPESIYAHAATLRALSGWADRDDRIRKRMLESLQDDEALIRRGAVDGLASLCDTDMEVRSAVFSMLTDPDAGVRAAAVSALLELDPVGKEVRDAAMALSQETNDEIRERLIRAAMGEGSALDMRRFSLNSSWIMNSFPRDLLCLSNFKG